MGGGFYEYYPSACGEVVIYKVIILVLTVLVGLSLIYKHTLDTPSPYVPYFHIKQCFRFNLEKGPPSGIIAMFDGPYYMVMWYGEADRRYAGPKMGARVSMKWLDMYAHRIKCPQGWGEKP